MSTAEPSDPQLAGGATAAADAPQAPAAPPPTKKQQQEPLKSSEDKGLSQNSSPTAATAGSGPDQAQTAPEQHRKHEEVSTTTVKPGTNQQHQHLQRTIPVSTSTTTAAAAAVSTNAAAAAPRTDAKTGPGQAVGLGLMQQFPPHSALRPILTRILQSAGYPPEDIERELSILDRCGVSTLQNLQSMQELHWRVLLHQGLRLSTITNIRSFIVRPLAQQLSNFMALSSRNPSGEVTNPSSSTSSTGNPSENHAESNTAVAGSGKIDLTVVAPGSRNPHHHFFGASSPVSPSAAAAASTVIRNLGAPFSSSGGTGGGSAPGTSFFAPTNIAGNFPTTTNWLSVNPVITQARGSVAAEVQNLKSMCESYLAASATNSQLAAHFLNEIFVLMEKLKRTVLQSFEGSGNLNLPSSPTSAAVAASPAKSSTSTTSSSTFISTTFGKNINLPVFTIGGSGGGQTAAPSSSGKSTVSSSRASTPKCTDKHQQSSNLASSSSSSSSPSPSLSSDNPSVSISSTAATAAAGGGSVNRFPSIAAPAFAVPYRLARTVLSPASQTRSIYPPNPSVAPQNPITASPLRSPRNLQTASSSSSGGISAIDFFSSTSWNPPSASSSSSVVGAADFYVSPHPGNLGALNGPLRTESGSGSLAGNPTTTAGNPSISAPFLSQLLNRTSTPQNTTNPAVQYISAGSLTGTGGSQFPPPSSSATSHHPSYQASSGAGGEMENHLQMSSRPNRRSAAQKSQTRVTSAGGGTATTASESMTPATAARGPGKRGLQVSCHQCKTSKAYDQLLFCTTKAEKGIRKRRCRKKFCFTCLARNYEGYDSCPEDWVCPACLEVCQCIGCLRKIGKAGGQEARRSKELVDLKQVRAQHEKDRKDRAIPTQEDGKNQQQSEDSESVSGDSSTAAAVAAESQRKEAEEAEEKADQEQRDTSTHDSHTNSRRSNRKRKSPEKTSQEGNSMESSATAETSGEEVEQMEEISVAAILSRQLLESPKSNLITRAPISATTKSSGAFKAAAADGKSEDSGTGKGSAAAGDRPTKRRRQSSDASEEGRAEKTEDPSSPSPSASSSSSSAAVEIEK